MPKPRFESLGTERELRDALLSHQRLNSDAAIGERIAATLLSKTPRAVAEVVRKFDAEDEAGHVAVEYLFHAQANLTARLKAVEAAIARLTTVGERMHRKDARHG